MPIYTPFVTADILQIQKYVLKMQSNAVHHRLVKDYELDYQSPETEKSKSMTQGSASVRAV